MKLVLYSDQGTGMTDSIDERLFAFIGKSNPRIGYIPSGADLNRTYFMEKERLYRRLGATDVIYFDLDMEYDESRIAELFSCDAIHLSEGNTFYFLKNLKRRGFLQRLTKYVEQGGTLIGVSAGSVLMTARISTAGFCDENEVNLSDLTSLGLVDFEFFPHFEQYRDKFEALLKYSKNNGRPIYLCNDGDGILIKDKEIEFIGNIIKLDAGIKQPVR